MEQQEFMIQPAFIYALNNHTWYQTYMFLFNVFLMIKIFFFVIVLSIYPVFAFCILKRKGVSPAADIMSLISCRWSQNLAEQISPWRSELPGGCKLCVCAHWPLLKRATAGLLLNVINRGPQFAPAVLPPPWRGAQCSMKYELDTLTLFTVPKHLRKKEKKNTHKESRRSPASPRLYSCSFLSFFSVLSRLAKNKD